jgi:predicted nucleotidyltransferase
MLDLSGVPDSLLEVVLDVVSEVRRRAPGLNPSDIMVVGAACRDVLHAASPSVRSDHASWPSAGRATSNFWCARSSWAVVRHGRVGDPGRASSLMP